MTHTTTHHSTNVQGALSKHLMSEPILVLSESEINVLPGPLTAHVEIEDKLWHGLCYFGVILVRFRHKRKV